MDLEPLPAPPRPRPSGTVTIRGGHLLADAMREAQGRVAVAMAAAIRKAAKPCTPAERAHRRAEQALLAAAVRHGKAQAAMKERGGVLVVRQEAAAAHVALDHAAVAYAAAHAALVAAS